MFSLALATTSILDLGSGVVVLATKTRKEKVILYSKSTPAAFCVREREHAQPEN